MQVNPVVEAVSVGEDAVEDAEGLQDEGDHQDGVAAAVASGVLLEAVVGVDAVGEADVRRLVPCSRPTDTQVCFCT